MTYSYYCGECGEECDPIFSWKRTRPTDVLSDCCGEDVYHDDMLTNQVLPIEFDPDFNPFSFAPVKEE